MSITKQFGKYVSQNIFGMLGVSCYIIADTFFIAKAAGTNGITVLNLVLPIFNLIFAIGAMTGVGSATRFTILRAQKDATAENYFSNAVFCACILGAVFILAGIFVPDKILAIMGGDETIVALGTGYMRIILMFAPFFMLNHIISSFVRNDGAPSLAMIGTLAGSLFNIVFDYIFMFPMKLGLVGAALATAASPVISIIICSKHFLDKKNTIRFVWSMPSAKRLFQSWQLGVSAFVGEISSGVTTTVFNFLILGLVGNVGVAAYGVIANFALIATAIFNGVSQGSQPLLSEYYGKGDTASVRKILGLSIKTALILAVAVLIVVYLFTTSLVALFNSENSTQMAEYAYMGMRLYFIGFLFAGFNIVGTGFLSATDRSKEAFITSMMRGFVAIIACSLLLASIFGLNGVWVSFAVSECLTALLLIGVLRKDDRIRRIL